MPFAAQRRVGVAKYGKNKTKALGYNFFDDTAKDEAVAPPKSKFPISPESPNTRSFNDDVPVHPPSSPSRTASPANLPAHVTTHSRSSFSAVPGSRSGSPLKLDAGDMPAKDASTFDLVSSGDEHYEQASRPLKKRKLQFARLHAGTNHDSGNVQRAGTVELPLIKAGDRQFVSEPKPSGFDGQSTTQSPLCRTEVAAKRDAEVKEKTKAKGTATAGVAEVKPHGSTTSIGEDLNFIGLVGKSDQQGQTGHVFEENATESTTGTRLPARKQLKSVKSAQNILTQAVDPPAAAQLIEEAQVSKRLVTSRPLKVPDADEASTKGAKTQTRVKKRAKKDTPKTPSKGPLVGSNVQSQPQGTDVIMHGFDDMSRLSPVSSTKNEDSMILSTPRRMFRRGPPSNASGASPSQLGFRDLRLSPRDSQSSRRASSTSTTSSLTSPSQQNRSRRIDHLDVPGPSTSQSQSRDRSGTKDLHLTKAEREPLSKGVGSSSTATVPALDRSTSSQTRQAYGRSKNTYGKERSHLANMVDDLGAWSDSSGQEASQQLQTQLAAAAGPSQLQQELSLEESSGDDAIAGNKLKSIHELRQAGTNNRFERELEALLDDVDPRTSGASKALRMQALVKIFRKMGRESNFEAFVSDQALDRLAAWSNIVNDKLSKMLFDMIFWRLVHAKNVTPRKLSVMAQAIAASTDLISDLGSMARLARDRKENVSKVMIKDLQAFEQIVLTESLLPAYEGEHIVPAAIVLGALNDSLRKLTEASASNVTLGKTAYDGVLVILREASEKTIDGQLRNPFIAKVALSLLQLFSGPLESDFELSSGEYTDIGSTLASIIDCCLDEREDLVQSVLHFAISLCNDRPHVCLAMSSSNLGDSLTIIVLSRFMPLVKAASSGQMLETAILDSIILSLACLLNMTEYDNSVRTRFALSKTPTGNTQLHDLVWSYTRAAPRLAQAQTAEQSQALVAFGYLSLLICNLCLEPGLWRQTSKILDTYKMSDVVVSAKELLIHLRTLEMAQLEGDISMLSEAGGGAMDGFTQRFEQIIAAVPVK